MYIVFFYTLLEKRKIHTHNNHHSTQSSFPVSLLYTHFHRHTQALIKSIQERGILRMNKINNHVIKQGKRVILDPGTSHMKI